MYRYVLAIYSGLFMQVYNEEIRIFALPMSVSTETLKQDLDKLTHNQLQQVADFIAFLKFRDRHQHRVVLDST